MTGPRITLTEYGRLHVGRLDPAKPAITPAQAARLTDLKKVYGFEIFKWINQHTLAAQQYVGTVQLGPLAIEILPKIEGCAESSVPVVRRNLVAMLMVAHNLEVRDGDIARLATQQNGILEILIGLFCERLFAQLRRGVIRQYDPCEGNFAVLRGKLLVSEQLRLNAAHPERLYCRFDELHEDIPLNQIFKAAIRLLLQVSRDLNNQRQLRELLLGLEGISDVATPSLEWNKVNFNRLNDRYRSAFGLAKLFLKGTPPDVTSGLARGFSLFFDMNTLFEQYIGRIATRAFRPFRVDVRLQGPQRYLAFDELSGANAFAMKPDVSGISNGRVKWIIDCKWKQLSEDDARQGAQQADLYQMYAYANNYHCPNVVLLYPHHLALRCDAGVMATYTLHEWVGNARGQIRVATVDLSDLRTMQSQLCALFPDTVEALKPVDERCTA